MKPFYVDFDDDIEGFAGLCELQAGESIQPVFWADTPAIGQSFFFATPLLRASLRLFTANPSDARTRIEASGRLRIFRASVFHWGLEADGYRAASGWAVKQRALHGESEGANGLG